jgi:hypothetical protein
MNPRRDFRIPFFPCKLARPEECREGDTEGCSEVGGVKTPVGGEELDDGDEEVRREREAFAIGFVTVESSTAADSEVDKGVVKDL